jgi:hypothetical protein
MEKTPINIWDDYDGDETYFHVDDSDIPLENRRAYLDILLAMIEVNELCPGLEFEMYLYDTVKEYPRFISSEYEHMCYKDWQLKVKGLTHEKRESLLERLKEGDVGELFDVYSES